MSRIYDVLSLAFSRLRWWLAAVLMAVVFWAGWTLSAARYVEAQRRQAEALAESLVKESLRANEAASAYEQLRASREARSKVITKELIREVEKPVYGECRIPDDGLRLLNEARRPRSPASESAGGLSRSPVDPSPSNAP